MRRMAFSKTIPQMRAGVKTVTRRDGWENARPEEIVIAIEKGQGLKKGERQVVIRNILLVDVRRESLGAITEQDVLAEGFGDLTPAEFIEMFGKPADFVVTRIEFRHLFGTEPKEHHARSA